LAVAAVAVAMMAVSMEIITMMVMCMAITMTNTAAVAVPVGAVVAAALVAWQLQTVRLAALDFAAMSWMHRGRRRCRRSGHLFLVPLPARRVNEVDLLAVTSCLPSLLAAVVVLAAMATAAAVVVVAVEDRRHEHRCAAVSRAASAWTGTARRWRGATVAGRRLNTLHGVLQTSSSDVAWRTSQSAKMAAIMSGTEAISLTVTTVVVSAVTAPAVAMATAMATVVLAVMVTAMALVSVVTCDHRGSLAAWAVCIRDNHETAYPTAVAAMVEVVAARAGASAVVQHCQSVSAGGSCSTDRWPCRLVDGRLMVTSPMAQRTTTPV
jgi:hypothetical protein